MTRFKLWTSVIGSDRSATATSELQPLPSIICLLNIDFLLKLPITPLTSALEAPTALQSLFSLSLFVTILIFYLIWDNFFLFATFHPSLSFYSFRSPVFACLQLTFNHSQFPNKIKKNSWKHWHLKSLHLH